MALETVVIAADPDLLGVVRRAMEGLEAEVVALGTSEDGALLLARRKFDAVVVDYDDDAVPGVCRLLPEIRRGTSNRSSIVFALVGDPNASRRALADGANFVVPKPLDPERIARVFRSALGLMRRENRRYFRLAIELPVTMEAGDGAVHRSTTMNLSKKGLALRECALAAGARARIRTFLPGGLPLECTVEVAWTARTGSGPAGLRILDMAENDSENLAEFIDRAAENAELASHTDRRHRSIITVGQSSWWDKLKRKVLRSIGRRLK